MPYRIGTGCSGNTLQRPRAIMAVMSRRKYERGETDPFHLPQPPPPEFASEKRNNAGPKHNTASETPKPYK